MTGEPYDALAPLDGFVGHRSTAARRRDRTRPSPPMPATVVLPFGTRDRGLVRYVVLLDEDLAERVASRLRAGRSGESFGQLAFAAITGRPDEMRALLCCEPAGRYSALRTLRPRPIPPGVRTVRRTSRLTLDQAVAVDEIRRSLGRIEMGQLHRLALDLHLTQ